MRMKKKIIAIFVILVQLCLLCFTGCGKRLGDDDETGGVTSADGRYKEYKISQIGEIGGIYAYKQFNDTCILICRDDKAKLCIYESTDNGLNWEQSGDMERIVSVIGDGFIEGADVNDKGEYVFGISGEGNNVSQKELVIVNATGDKTSFTLEGNMKHVRFTNDGTNILVNSDDKIMRYDRNGTLVVTYPVSGCLDFCEASDESIIFLTQTALYQYSKEGTLTETDIVLSDNLSDELRDLQNLVTGLIGGSYIGILKIDGDDNLCIMLSSGIYRHSMGSKVITQMVDNTSTSFVGGRSKMLDFLSSGEDFYVLLSDGAILRYTTVDADEVAVNIEEAGTVELEDAELTIYTLYPSGLLDQVVGIFVARYPNVVVNIEVGIEEDSGISVNDAINALNTELLSGEGPDVLVLTGLDVDTYADNGMLMELSGVYDSVKNSHSEIFLNILDAYRREDGFIYALPIRFTAPVIVAEKDVLTTITDVDAVIDCIDTGKEYPKGNSLEIYYADELFNAFYPAYVKSIFDDAGNYNSDELKKFMEDMKRIWEIIRAQTTVEEQEKMNVEIDICKNNLAGETRGLLERAESEQDIAISSISLPLQFFYLVTLMNNDDSYAFQSFSYDGSRIFEPKFTMGIHSGTAYPEAAKRFVEELFDDDAQLIYSDVERGEPLNLEPELEFYEGAGSKNVIFSFPTEELRDYMMDFFRSLDTPISMNPIISEIILTDFESYLNGDISLEDYMNSLNSSIELYMSE